MASTIAEAFVTIRPDTRGFRGELSRDLSTATAGAGGAMAASGKKAGAGFLGGMGATLAKGAAIVAAPLAGLAALGGGIGVKMAANLEQAEIGFTTMLGSAEAAKAFLGDLADFAATTPFEFPELVGASQRLLAMGFEADEVRPTLTAVGDAVAALGGGSEGIDQVTRALGQMQAKGRVQAEEMLQLTEAGIPAWEILAEKMGVDVPTAMEQVTAGAVNADTAIGALTEGMSDRFGGLMEKQSQSLSGLFSTLKDTVTMGLAEAVTPIMPQLKRGVEALTAAAGPFFEWLADRLAWLAEHGPSIVNGLGAAFDTVRTVVGNVRSVVEPVLTWLRDTWASLFGGGGQLVGQAQGMLASLTPVWANVRGIVSGALEAVRAVIQVFVNVARGFWDRFGTHIVAFAQRSWGNIVRVVEGVTRTIRGIIEAFTGIVTGDWDRFLGGVKMSWSGLWNAAQGIVRQGLEVIRTIIGAVTTAISQAWSFVWNAVRTFLSNTWDRIVASVRDRIASVRTNIATTTAVIAEVWRRFWDGVRSRAREMMDNVKTAISTRIETIVGWFRNLPGRIGDAIGNVARALVQKGKDLVQGLIDGIKNAAKNIGKALSGLISSAWDAINPFGDGYGIDFSMGGGGAAPPLRPAAGWQAMTAAGNASGLGLRMSSGYRPGAITATGNPSYHGMGRATDWFGTPAQMAAFSQWVARNYGGITRELIYSGPGGVQLHNGRPHQYRGVTRSMHYDHVHWALANGGWVKAKPGVGVIANIGEGRHDEVVAPEPMLRRLLAETRGGDGVTIQNLNYATPGDVRREVRAALMEARVRGGR